MTVFLFLLYNTFCKIYETISGTLQFSFTEVKMTKKDGSGDMMNRKITKLIVLVKKEIFTLCSKIQSTL